jgi:Protein of unknown function (DUF3618)
MNDYSRDASRIERELAETRARLGDHLEELTRRLSPGQLLDEGISYLRNGQGAAFMRNLGEDLRDNPLPVAMTAIGVAWLAVASNTSGGRNSRALVPYDRAQSWRGASDDLADRARRAGDAVTRAAEETEESFRSRVAEARARVLGLQQNAAETASVFADRVQQAMDTAQQRARESFDRMRQSAADWRDGIAETGQQAGAAVSQAAQRSRDYATRAGSGISETMGDNPLLLGALGLAAGALIGAVLPRTRQEEAVMRPATDWAANTARDAASEVMERGTRAAEAAASAAYEAVRK